MQHGVVLYFAGGNRRILGRENLCTVMEELGEDMDAWVGAVVRLEVSQKRTVALEVVTNPATIRVSAAPEASSPYECWRCRQECGGWSDVGIRLLLR